jgi:cytochrome c1
MKLSQLRQIIKEEIHNTLNEGSSLADKASDLYDKILRNSNIDDEAVDSAMEGIVRKTGYTPEQKAMKNPYVFAFGDHPEFETLTDQQLLAVIEFLEKVKKKGKF